MLEATVAGHAEREGERDQPEGEQRVDDQAPRETRSCQWPLSFDSYMTTLTSTSTEIPRDGLQ